MEKGEIQKKTDAAVIVNLFEGARPSGATGAIDKALSGQLRAAIGHGDFTGKRNELLLLYGGGGVAAKRVLIVGLGPRKSVDLEVVREAAGTAAGYLQKMGLSSASSILHGAGAGKLNPELVAEAIAEASILACYRFDAFKTRKKTAKPVLKKLTIVELEPQLVTSARRGARTGRQIAEATCLARDLANQPGNSATPTYLARTARSIARTHGLSCQVLDETRMRKLGMGALLAVSQGSAQKAQFIVLEHNKRAAGNPLVFVGKGVTFDSGGISIKPGGGMEDMKFDMCGGAAVLGAMQAVAALKLPCRVVGIVPATENLPDGKSFKPGDIVTTLSGKTIEIQNTDAEGRLILADALAYAARFKPAAVVDLATLTGACVVALGHHASGMMGNDDDLAEKVRAAGEATAERVWPLPLWDEYRRQIRSDFADMKNTGGRPGGAITGAALLAEFTDYPWVHLDIAGTAWSSRTRPYIPKGGVGIGVRLLTHLARHWKKKKA